MPQTWNPREVLDVYPEGPRFTCVGTTKRGTRCGNSFIKNEYLRTAGRLLDNLPELDDNHTTDNQYLEKLKEIAWHTLCPRWHQDKLPQSIPVARKWLRLIGDLRRQSLQTRRSNASTFTTTTCPSRTIRAADETTTGRHTLQSSEVARSLNLSASTSSISPRQSGHSEQTRVTNESRAASVSRASTASIVSVSSARTNAISTSQASSIMQRSQTSVRSHSPEPATHSEQSSHSWVAPASQASVTASSPSFPKPEEMEQSHHSDRSINSNRSSAAARARDHWASNASQATSPSVFQVPSHASVADWISGISEAVPPQSSHHTEQTTSQDSIPETRAREVPSSSSRTASRVRSNTQQPTPPPTPPRVPSNTDTIGHPNTPYTIQINLNITHSHSPQQVSPNSRRDSSHSSSRRRSTSPSSPVSRQSSTSDLGSSDHLRKKSTSSQSISTLRNEATATPVPATLEAMWAEIHRLRGMLAERDNRTTMPSSSSTPPSSAAKREEATLSPSTIRSRTVSNVPYPDLPGLGNDPFYSPLSSIPLPGSGTSTLENLLASYTLVTPPARSRRGSNDSGWLSGMSSPGVMTPPSSPES